MEPETPPEAIIVKQKISPSTWSKIHYQRLLIWGKRAPDATHME